jgi:uncharacterized ubiquitin-like protein YukD
MQMYELDQITNEWGHQVIRLPPHYCQCNPIELIWVQEKIEVADRNKTLKLAYVQQLMSDMSDKVTV